MKIIKVKVSIVSIMSNIYINPFIFTFTDVEFKMMLGKQKEDVKIKINRIYSALMVYMGAHNNQTKIDRNHQYNDIFEHKVSVIEIQMFLNSVEPIYKLLFNKNMQAIMKEKISDCLILLRDILKMKCEDFFMHNKYMTCTYKDEFDISLDNSQIYERFSFDQVIDLSVRMKSLPISYRTSTIDTSDMVYCIHEHNHNSWLQYLPDLPNMTVDTWLKHLLVHIFDEYTRGTDAVFILTKEMIQNNTFKFKNYPGLVKKIEEIQHRNFKKIVYDNQLVSSIRDILTNSPEFIKEHYVDYSKIDMSDIYKSEILTSIYNAKGLVYSLKYFYNIDMYYKNIVEMYIQPYVTFNFNVNEKNELETLINNVRLKSNPPEEQINLLPEQWQAVENAIQYKYMCISGPGGSGKSTIMEYLYVYLNHNIEPVYNPENGEEEIQIIVTAFKNETVDASKKRLKKYTGKNNNTDFKTLHSLLYSKTTNFQKIKALIIDEASMVNKVLLYRILKKLTNLRYVCLFGDYYQLGPTVPGNIFRILCQLFKHTVYLTVNKRTKHIHMAEMLQNVRTFSELKPHERPNMFDGGIKPILCLNSTNLCKFMLTDIQLSSKENKNKDQAEVMLHKLGLKIIEILKEIDPGKTVKMYDDTMCICPFNDPLRIINNYINHYYFNTPYPRYVYAAITYVKGVKVHFNVTCKDRDIFKGGSGKIISVTKDDYTVVTTDEREINVARDEIDCASCITVHKAQGKQASHIIAILPPHPYAWYNAMLYTLLSRTKSNIYIISTYEYIQKMLSAPNPKDVSLLDFI